VRVAVEKIPGVEDVTVSLNDGMTVVRFARVNRATVSQVRRAIREKGFTPKDADVRVRGTVDLRGDTLVLVIPDVGTAIPLRAPPALREQLRETIGRVVEIEGRVPQDGTGPETPAIIELKTVRLDPGSSR
jgi:hypothetical protein